MSSRTAADVAILSATIRTLDPDRPEVSAVAFRDGTIVCDRLPQFCNAVYTPAHNGIVENRIVMDSRLLGNGNARGQRRVIRCRSRSWSYLAGDRFVGRMMTIRKYQPTGY